jgi:ABC-type transporter Mla maintaining outer membrane lipid asymmetry permease subunit MlaE
VGGRVGAGFTAEIGSMAVTEQIDAIRPTMATTPSILTKPNQIYKNL